MHTHTHLRSGRAVTPPPPQPPDTRTHTGVANQARGRRTEIFGERGCAF